MQRIHTIYWTGLNTDYVYLSLAFLFLIEPESPLRLISLFFFQGKHNQGNKSLQKW